MPRSRLTAPRSRLAFAVGGSLLTVVVGAFLGYAIWQVTESDFNLESPEQARSMGAIDSTATVVPLSRVIRLTPDTLVAPATVLTQPARAPNRESRVLLVVTRTSSLAPPTATTPAKGPDLVTNGSFEADASSWYIEGGAGPITGNAIDNGTRMLLIPAGGGYADQIIAVLPGETYELKGSGRMTGAGDTGLLGVVYRDGSGNRLQNLEPPPITFTETQFMEQVLEFTVPKEVADVYVYVYKESGPAQFEADGISVKSIDTP